MKREIALGQDTHEITMTYHGDEKFIQKGTDAGRTVSLHSVNGCRYQVTLGDIHEDVRLAAKGDDVFIQAFGRTFALNVLDPVDQALAAASAGDISPKAPMPGIVVEVHVNKGDTISKDDQLMTIESMKLLTVITAGSDGVIDEVHFGQSDSFNKGAVLISIARTAEQ